jgi:glycosyltransferase involved in cell wall biosynthesis
VLVAIPALNEAETIASVIAEVRAQPQPCSVVVIDDGSTDATAAVARAAGARVLQLPFNVGVGGAMRVAFLYAERNDFDAVVQVDADGQHDPTAIGQLLAGLSDASVVIGARFAGGEAYVVHGPRRWAMTTMAATLTRVTRTRLTDTTSGFRASDRRAIALFARHYPAEYLGDTIESLVIAARAGLRIAQVPVTMHPRKGWQASQRPLRASLYLGRAVLALGVALSRRSRLGAQP